MEPITININLNVPDKTLDRLRDIAAIFAAAVVSKKPAQTEPEAPAAPTEEKPSAAKQEAPAAEPASAAPAEESNTEEVSLEALFNAVKEARQLRGVKAATIKSIFTDKFGIPNSGACPPERRAELLECINSLTA